MGAALFDMMNSWNQDYKHFRARGLSHVKTLRKRKL